MGALDTVWAVRPGAEQKTQGAKWVGHLKCLVVPKAIGCSLCLVGLVVWLPFNPLPSQKRLAGDLRTAQSEHVQS